MAGECDITVTVTNVTQSCDTENFIESSGMNNII